MYTIAKRLILYGRFGMLRERVREKRQVEEGVGTTVSIYLFIRPVPGEICSRLKINGTLFELLGLFFSLAHTSIYSYTSYPLCGSADRRASQSRVYKSSAVVSAS
jgi:hypothetical protein